MWTDDVVHYSYDDGSSYSDPALIDFSVDDLSVAHLSVDDLSVDDLIIKLSADNVVTVDDLTVDDVKAKLTVDDLMVDGIAVDDWLFVVDGELLDYDHNPLGFLRNDTLHAYGHMADDVRKAGVSVDPLAFDDKFEAPYSGPDFEAYYYYWEVRRPQIEAHKAKLAREEAEASKLERAPADDRAAIDDTNAGPWYQRRLPSKAWIPKAWMIFGMAFFGMPLVGLCALGISLSLLDKIFLLARGILDKEVLLEAGSSKKTLAGGEGKGAPSSA